MVQWFLGLFRRKSNVPTRLDPLPSKRCVSNVGDLVDILRDISRVRPLECVVDGASVSTKVYCIDDTGKSVRIWSIPIAQNSKI